MISRNRSRESLRLSKNTSTDYENAYFGSEPVNEELTSVNNIFEDFTEIRGRVVNLLKPHLPAPAPTRPRSTSVTGSVLNNAMYEVTNSTTYDRVSGLLAILKSQISKLEDRSQAGAARGGDMAAIAAAAKGTSRHRVMYALHHPRQKRNCQC